MLALRQGPEDAPSGQIAPHLSSLGAEITQELEREKAEKRAAERVNFSRAFFDRSVLICTLSICLANVGCYVFVFWLPTTIHKASGLSPVLSVLLSALPYAVAVGFALWSGRFSDRSGKPKLQTSLLMALVALFLMLSVIPGQSFPLVMIWHCLAAGAIFA